MESSRGVYCTRWAPSYKWSHNNPIFYMGDITPFYNYSWGPPCTKVYNYSWVHHTVPNISTENNKSTENADKKKGRSTQAVPCQQHVPSREDYSTQLLLLHLTRTKLGGEAALLMTLRCATLQGSHEACANPDGISTQG